MSNMPAEFAHRVAGAGDNIAHLIVRMAQAPNDFLKFVSSMVDFDKHWAEMIAPEGLEGLSRFAPSLPDDAHERHGKQGL